jgi:lipopolysaccharide biosynthesis glycosyltransferase
MSKQTIVPVFYTVDNNYATVLHVGVQAIIDQADPKRTYHIHILGNALDQMYIDSFNKMATSNVKIFIDDVTEKSIKHAKEFYNRDYYTNTAWLRLFIPNMFPQYDKLVYLDADSVSNIDIAEYFDIDIEGLCAAATTCETCDLFPVFTDYVQKYMGFAMPWYFSSGVMLLNCKVMREDNFEAKFFDLIHKHKFELIQDQDCFNVLFRGRVKFLPQVYNKNPYVREGITDKDVKIAHYNLIFRPWRYDGVDFIGIKLDKIPFEDIFWKYAKRCPMYDKLLADKKAYTNEAKQKDVDMANNLVEIALREVALPREQTWAGLEFMRKVEIGKNL